MISEHQTQVRNFIPVLPTIAFVGGLILTGCSETKDADTTPVESTTAKEVPGTQTAREVLNPFLDGGGDRHKKKEAESQFPDLPTLAFDVSRKGLPTTGTWLGYPFFADLDNDGTLDVVASNREEDGYSIWKGTMGGSGEWLLRIDGIPRDMMYGSGAFGHFDGDEHLDLAINAHSDGLRVFLNDAEGNMTWSESTKAIKNLDLMLDVATGNLNGDGHLDLVLIGHFKGGIAMYEGDGEGGMTRLPESQSLVGNKVFGRDIELADMDGNGLDDIISTTDKGLKVIYTKMDEDYLYWEESSEGMPRMSIGNTIYTTFVGDFNHDGRQDVGYAAIPGEPGEDDTIGIMSWDAGKQTWVSIDTGLHKGSPFRDAEKGDFNGDGHLDLIAMHVMEGPLIYLNDGKGNFTLKGRIDWRVRGRCDVGDINGDGLPDIVISASAKSPDAQAGIRVFLNKKSLW